MSAHNGVTVVIVDDNKGEGETLGRDESQWPNVGTEKEYMLNIIYE